MFSEFVDVSQLVSQLVNWLIILTVLPQQSLGSSSEPRSSKSETTSVRPLQAAMWRAMRSPLSLKLTLTPESNSSLIPSRSPSFTEYISLTSGSIGLSTSSISSTAAAAVASCLSGFNFFSKDPFTTYGLTTRWKIY